MNAGELLDTFRVEMNDRVEPFLWRDELVLSYIDDAEKMFCRKTDNVPDSTTPEVTRLSVVPGTEWYPVSPLILKFRMVSRIDTGKDIDVLNREDMPKRGMYFDGRSGPVKALIIGMEKHKVRVWPVPSEAVTLELMVFRLPLARITDGDQELEIDEQHHRHLLLWVKHLAYSNQDTEAFDKTKAAEFEQRFLSYCEAAKVEERRLRHKTRTVEYGGY